MKPTTKINFAALSRSMLLLPEDEVGADRHALARRYLLIESRRYRVQRAIEAGSRRARRESPLHFVSFRPPLSVYGASGDVIAKATELAARGLPLAFSLDEKGAPRGAPVDDIAAALAKHLGRTVTAADVLEMYRHNMAFVPSMLPHHDKLKYRRIPHALNRLALVARHVEDQLAKSLVGEGRNEPIFTVIVTREDLAAAVEGADSKAIVVGYSAEHGLALNGNRCDAVWGKGGGLVVIDRRSLKFVLRRDAGEVVGIQCKLGVWTAWYTDVSETGADLPDKPVIVARYHAKR